MKVQNNNDYTYLLDTNMFSYIAKGTSPAARAEFQGSLRMGMRFSVFR